MCRLSPLNFVRDAEPQIFCFYFFTVADLGIGLEPATLQCSGLDGGSEVVREASDTTVLRHGRVKAYAQGRGPCSPWPRSAPASSDYHFIVAFGKI
jgi:hypothetical protein